MKIRIDTPATQQQEDVCIDVLKPGNVFMADGKHYVLTGESTPMNKQYAVKLTDGKLVEFAGDHMVVKRNDVVLSKTA